MKAQSVRHAEAFGVRSAGPTIADALHSMGYTGVGDVRQGKYFELELDARRRTQAERWRRDVADKLLANPVIESYRSKWTDAEPGSSHGEARTWRRLECSIMKFAVVVFPGSNCDHDAYHAAKHVLGQEAEFVWHKETSLEGRRRRDPAWRVLARRLPAHRRDRAVLAGHGARSTEFAPRADRCSASATASRFCSRRACCPGAMLRNRDLKFLCEHVQRARRADRHAVHPALRRARSCACRSLTAKATTSPTRDVWSARARPPGDLPLLRCRTAQSPTRRIRTGRRDNIAGICNERAQRRRPDAASRARLRADARQRRRPRALRIGRERARPAHGRRSRTALAP